MEITKHGEEVLQALKDLGNTDYEVMDYNNSILYFDKTVDKFGLNKKYTYPLWENLTDRMGVDYEYSWEWINDFLDNKEVLFFFEPGDDRRVFRFYNGADVVDILNNSYGFVFYITDEQQSFLLSYNDHDNLIACGSAKEWLASYEIVVNENIKAFQSDS